MKFIDLFAGIGGFHLAAKKSQYDLDCVLACEIDQKAQEVYSLNFPETPIVSDIRKLNIDDIPEYDVLFAGFPCQPFSNGGHKKGFGDEKNGNLFFELERIIKGTKPKLMLLENVKGILSNDSGRTIEYINKSLKRMGYITTKDNLLINSKDIGVPQNRERVYFMCIRKDLYNKKYIPAPTFIKVNYKFKTFNDKNLTIDEDLQNKILAWGEFVEKVQRPEGRTLPVIWLDEMVEPLPKNFTSLPIWKQKYIKDMKMVYAENKCFIDKWIKKHNANTWSKRDKKLEWQAGSDNYDINMSMLQLRQSGLRFSSLDSFPALVAMVQPPIKITSKRYYSLKELAQLQTYPSTYKFKYDYKTSLKQLGNGVTVDVVMLLINFLINELHSED